MAAFTPTPFPPAVTTRQVPPASFEFGFTELPVSRQTSTISPPLPEIPFSRHTSPILVSSFELNDGCQWGDGPPDSHGRPLSARQYIHARELSSVNEQDKGHSEWLCRLLVVFGWLPRLSKSGAGKHVPLLVTMLMDLFVLATTIHGGFVGPREERVLRLLHYVDSLARHGFIVVAHLGMYFVGGDDMSAAFRALECSVPHGHLVALSLLTALEFALDITLMCFRHSLYIDISRASLTNWTNAIAVLRRSFVMVERIPSAVSLMVMMAIPKRLCQDLVRTAIAIDTHDIPAAQRSYCVFWKHLRMGRQWYNAVMTAHFLIAVSRIPIGIYIVTHLKEILRSKSTPGFETIFLLAYTAVDTFQMLVWLQPAIVIRMNHGVVFRAAVEAAGHQTENATALATMMASLHPLAGLKMLGFLVTWNLVAKVTTFATVALTGLRMLVQNPPTTTPMTTTTNHNPMVLMWLKRLWDAMAHVIFSRRHRE